MTKEKSSTVKGLIRRLNIVKRYFLNFDITVIKVQTMTSNLKTLVEHKS